MSDDKKKNSILLEKFAKLIDVKSIVTLLFAGALVALLFADRQLSGELLALFCSVFSSIITYFFTKKSNKEDIGNDNK